MKYRSKQARQYETQRQQIMARIFDPTSSKEQIAADRIRLRVLDDAIRADIARINDDEEVIIAERVALAPVIERDWEDRRRGGIVSRLWHTFTYLVFAQRIGHHLFSESASSAIKKMNK